MLPSEPYLYHSVVNISNVLKVTQIKLITNNHYYVIVKTGHAESLECTPHYEIKQCCHFLITKCKIFKFSISISISIFYFCSATRKTERNKQTYRTIAEEEKGRSNKTLNVIACRQ